MLTAEQLAEAAAIFDEIADLPAAARAAALDARCGDRIELRRELESLLGAHERTGAFMRMPERDGLLIGAWRLLERIGSGGMGDVYLAERADGAYAGRAAVKMMRTQLRDEGLARRFRTERQILASLQHPGIVTLLDGGTTPDGHPYIVMEHVAGTPIGDYCAAQQLPLDARLALMRRVCEAVQYAHQRGIVHRDLKPANILVTADGTPKILDFGVAKLVEDTDEVHATKTGILGPLTPNYASPEQLRGLPVTTACDVYSLGVLLYEVLGGARPYDTKGLTLDAVLTAVVETQPMRPSQIAGDGPPLPYPRARLRGDLDAIVLKALRKEPEERYGSAGALADDLGRVLRSEPVLAREPSAGYLLRRLASRHRAATMIAAAACVAVLTALGVAVWQRQVAVAAQRRAETRFREVRQLSNALIFRLHDSVAKLPGSTPVRRQIVTEALGYLERLAAEARNDTALSLELAGAYRQIASILGDPSFPNLGDPQGALVQGNRSLELLRPIVAAKNPPAPAYSALVDTCTLVRRLHAAIGDRDKALAMAEEAVRASQAAVDRGIPGGTRMLAAATYSLAGMVTPLEAKLPHWEKTARLYEALLAEQPGDRERQRNVALVGRNYGGLLNTLKRPDEARVLFERALALDQKRLLAAPDDRMAQLDTSFEYSQLAGLLTDRGDHAGALALQQKSLALREALAGSDPEDVLMRGRLAYTRMTVARLQVKTGDARAALVNARLAVAGLEVQGTAGRAQDTESLGDALDALGEVEWALGDRAAACRHFTRAVSVLETVPQSRSSVVPRATALAARCR
jgi:serine/threonine protein kinase